MNLPHTLHRCGPRVEAENNFLSKLLQKPGKEIMLPKQGTGGGHKTDGLAENLDTEDVRERGESERACAFSDYCCHFLRWGGERQNRRDKWNIANLRSLGVGEA